MGRLRILTPGLEPACLPLPAEVATLGRRDDNPLCVPDASISGQHCQLGEADGTLTLLDLGSTNGSYFRDERIEQVTLKPGDTFRLGAVEFRYELEDAPAAQAAPAEVPVAPKVETPAPAPAPEPPAPVVVAPVASAPVPPEPVAPPEPTVTAPVVKAPVVVAPTPAAPTPAAPKPEAPKLPSLTLPTPAPAATPPAAAPAAPKLDPMAALRASLAKAGATPPAPTPSPAPATPAPPASKPDPVAPSPAPVPPAGPGAVKPPEPSAAPKLSLGGGGGAPAPAASAPKPPAPVAPGKVIPTGEPSKLSLGHGKAAAPAPTAPAVAPATPAAPAAPKPGGVVPTGGPSKLSLGGGHKAETPAAPAPPSPPKPPTSGGVAPPGGPSKLALGGGHKAAHAPAAPAATPAAPAAPAALAPGQKPCKRHPALPVKHVCKKCHAEACDECSPATEVAGKPKHYCPTCRNMCVSLAEHEADQAKLLARDGMTFRQRLPGVFKYPFHKNGLWFLIIGSIVFVALDFAGRLSWKLAIIGLGYLFAYMQRIVQSSAQAEDELPGFPEVSEWRTELLRPFALLAWTFIVSFGPAFTYMIGFAIADREMSLPVLFPLFALGFLYFPMALLAVSMSNSYTAVNPLVVLPAITRLNLEYVAATAVFFGLVAARYLTESLLGALVPVPVLPTLVSGFLALYFLACEMRLLGLMYHAHRRRLGWFSH